MRIVCDEQHTPEWYEARLGKVTASNMLRAMKKLGRASNGRKKGEWAQDHWNYAREIAWELVNRVPYEHYVSRPMDLGTQYESTARIEYEMETGFDVRLTGFALHPTLDHVGVSPDGLIGQQGGLELKVPLPGTHWSYLCEGVLPQEYRPQVYTLMWCGPLEWVDFVSYCPQKEYPYFNDAARLFIQRTTIGEMVYTRSDGEELRGEAIFAEMEEAVLATMQHAADEVGRLLERYPQLTRIASRPSEPKTIRIGELDVPEDIIAMLDMEELVP